MSCITRERHAESADLIIEGVFAGGNVSAIEVYYGNRTSPGLPVRLVLRDVISLNEDAWAFVAKLLSSGTEIRASGICTSYFVEPLHAKHARPRGAA